MTNDIAGEKQATTPAIWTHAYQHLLGHNLVDLARKSEFGTVQHLRLGARIEHLLFIRRDDLLAIHNFEN